MKTLPVLALLLAACTSPGDTDVDTDMPPDTDDTAPVDPDGRTETAFRADFVAKALELWPGTDYTYGGDGTEGIDGAGTVYVTLQAIFVDERRALTASDFHDEVVIADLQDSSDTLVQDLTWSNTAARRLDYGSIEPLFAE